MNVSLFGYQVQNSATTCTGGAFDGTIWHIRDLGNGVTPLSFSPHAAAVESPTITKGVCLRVPLEGQPLSPR